jgi:hypothetical protein
MELILGYEILESYKRLPYKAWFAFAEFIDNSTQSYRNHKAVMDTWFEEDDEMLQIKISYSNKKGEGYIKITDNAFGMNLIDLQNALTIGKKPEIHNERSKFGLGLKTAAFWFGNEWTIETTQRDSPKILTVTVNIHSILAEEKAYYAKFKKDHPNEPLVQFRPQLNITEAECAEDEHGTKIFITDLVRTITSPTAKNCVEYLQSIYRVDLQNHILDLEFQGTELSWSQDDIDDNLLVDSSGVKYKRDINFTINGKTVSGWAGILSKGAKSLGGFSLIQADRVIVGYPKNYRNESLFGAEDGGRNDLTNQRLTGELHLDEKFGVSHTKDQIVFVDDEEEELDKALFGLLADYKKESNIPFKARETKHSENKFDFESAVVTVMKNLESSAFQDVLLNNTILPLEAIERSNEETVNRLLNSRSKIFQYVLDGVMIQVILSDNSSPYDPYLIVRPLGGEQRIDIVLNINHPYWIDLEDNNSRFNFLLSCVYDGVAEWKAGFRLHRLDPDTIKSIKDSLLRLELKMS